MTQIHNNALPNGWHETPLGKIAHVQTGPFGSQLHAYDYTEQGIPVVMPRDLINGSISVTTIARIEQTTASRLSRHYTKAGDILLARRGDIGRAALVRDTEENWICGTGCLRVRLNNQAVSKFVYMLMARTDSVKWLSDNAVGQTMLNLSAGVVSKLPLTLPPLDEQARIVAILDDADAAVRAADALIDANKRHKNAVAERLLDGTGKGLHWHSVKIGDMIAESRIPASGEHSLKRMTVKLHLEGIEPRTRQNVEAEGATVYYQRRAGQLIYGKQNLQRGAIGIVPDYLDGWTSSQDVPAFDWKPGYVPDFVLRLLSRKHFYESLERLATGTGSKRIHPETLYKISVFVPDEAEQRHIAETLSLMDEEISLLKQQRNTQAKLKQGLMHDLLNGIRRTVGATLALPSGNADDPAALPSGVPNTERAVPFAADTTMHDDTHIDQGNASVAPTRPEHSTQEVTP